MKRFITSIFLTLTILLSTTLCNFGVLTFAVDEPTGTTFHFLDVNSLNKESGGPIGSADCIVIVDHDYDVVTMVDTGTEHSTSTAKVVKYVKDLGIDKIDHLFLTHPHNDHYGGVSAVVEAFDIVNAYYTTLFDWDKIRPCEIDYNTKWFYDKAIKSLTEKINSDGTGVNIIQPDKEGKVYEITPESHFTVYNCLAVVKNNFREPEFNDFSMMMKYSHKNVDALLTGDINLHYEYTLMGQVTPDGTRVYSDSSAELKAQAIDPVGEIEIFKLPHHGTKGSLSTETFLNTINPNKTQHLAVITGYIANVGGNVRGRMIGTYNYKMKITSGTNGSADVTIHSDGNTATFTDNNALMTNS